MLEGSRFYTILIQRVLGIGISIRAIKNSDTELHWYLNQVGVLGMQTSSDKIGLDSESPMGRGGVFGSKKLGYRDPSVCTSVHLNTSFSPSKLKNQIITFQDEKLKRLVEIQGERWDFISSHFADRTDVQCQHRWQKVVNPELVKGTLIIRFSLI